MNVTRRLLSALLVLAVTTTGCANGTDGPTDDVTDASYRDFAGDDLFRGIVLGYGPAVDLVPEVADHFALANYVEDPEHRAEVEAFYDRIVEEIDAIDPGFFARFEATLASGDPVAIDAILGEAGTLTKKGLLRIPEFAQALGLAEIDVQRFENGELTPAELDRLVAEVDPDNLGIVFAVYFLVVVHNHAAVTAAVAAVAGAVLAVAIEVYAAPPEDGLLLRDRIVARIAEEAYDGGLAANG
jgi:SdpC family antimicrobial peptide